MTMKIFEDGKARLKPEEFEVRIHGFLWYLTFSVFDRLLESNCKIQTLIELL